nr:L-ascorbate oxidase-like [Ipomoea batatas]
MRAVLNTNSTAGNGVYTFRFNSTVDVIPQNTNALAANVLGYEEGRFREEDAGKFNLKNLSLRNTVVVFPYGWTTMRTTVAKAMTSVATESVEESMAAL